MTHQTHSGSSSANAASGKRIWFDRRELDLILWTYGKLVAEGECRDYAIGAHSEYAAFCMYKRAAEAPTWTIEKWPELARKQGAYSLVNSTGQIIKRGHELDSVLRFFDRKRFQVID